MEPIELIVTLDESGVVSGVARFRGEINRIPDATNAAAKSAAGMGAATQKATEAGRLGFFALGQAVEDATRRFGVAGQASSQMGNSVGRLAASTLPGLGMALGIATLAIGSAVAMASRYIERKKEMREATLKAADAANEWLKTAYAEEKQTRALTEAEERHLEAKQKLQRINLSEGIEAEKKEVKELREEMVSLTRTYNAQIEREKEFGRQLDTTFFGKSTAARLAEITKKAAELDEKLRGIAEKEERLADTENRKPKRPGSKEDDLAGIEMENRAYAAQREWEIEQRIMEARRVYEEAQLKSHQDTTKSEINTDQQLLQNKAVVFGGISQILNQAYTLGHQRSKALFYASRAAAAAESIIQGHLAGSKAIGELGPFGLPISPVLVGMGYANAAMIAAQTFEGGGGSGSGGGAAMPSFGGGGSGSGLPANGGYKYYGYEQSQYGSGWRPGEGPGGQSITIHAVDAKSFVELCEKNPDGINKAVQQNIKDKGDTRAVIQRYANS